MTSPDGLAASHHGGLRIDRFLTWELKAPKTSVTVTKVKLHHLLSSTLGSQWVSLSPYWIGQTSHTPPDSGGGNTGPSSQWEGGKVTLKPCGTRDIAVVIFGKYLLPSPTPMLPSMAYKALHVPTLECKLRRSTGLVFLTMCLLYPAQCMAHSRPSFSFGGLMSALLPSFISCFLLHPLTAHPTHVLVLPL